MLILDGMPIVSLPFAEGQNSIEENSATQECGTVAG